jgi:hypothetical protein
MHLIINSECTLIPKQVKPQISEGTVLLNLLSCLGYETTNPPLADLLRRTSHLDGDWIILSPFHYQATHNDAFITAMGKELKLEKSEAKFWFHVFKEYLESEGMILYYYEAELWLLQAPKAPPLKAKPVYQLAKESLMAELAQLDSTLFWQKFVTESQMLFASKPNQTGMNSLWPWGNARIVHKKDKIICTDESFLPFAKELSTKVNLYSPKIRLKEQDILLISRYSDLSESHQEELKKLPVHWHWNNTAYVCKADNWLIDLWRKWTHAY